MPLNTLIDSGQPILPLPDVQHTTLGIDLLSRFVRNTWDAATANGTRRFDAGHSLAMDQTRQAGDVLDPAIVSSVPG